MGKIRKALYNDSPILAKIHAESFVKAYRNIIPKEILTRINIEKRKIIFENSIRNGSEKIYLIEEESRVYGFIIIGKCRDNDKPSLSGEVWGIYIHPQYWGKGYGKRLMKYAEKTLKERGFKEIYLWVLEDNLTSRNFYEHLGYKTEGSKKVLKHLNNIKSVRYQKNL